MPLNSNDDGNKKLKSFNESEDFEDIMPLNKTKSHFSMANVNMNNDNITGIDDNEFIEEDEMIQNKDINLLGTDNKDRIDIIASNSTGFYIAGNDGILSNIQYIIDKKKNTTSICQLIQSFSLPSKNTRIKSSALSRFKDFMFVLTDINQILKINVELGSSEVKFFFKKYNCSKIFT